MPPTELLSRVIFNKDVSKGEAGVELDRAFRIITDVLVEEKPAVGRSLKLRPRPV